MLWLNESVAQSLVVTLAMIMNHKVGDGTTQRTLPHKDPGIPL
jgi:hypothetical protein